MDRLFSILEVPNFALFKSYLYSKIKTLNKNDIPRFCTDILGDILYYTLPSGVEYSDKMQNVMADTLQLLLRNGADPNIESNDYTALQHFILMDNINAVTTLVKFGADINKCNNTTPSFTPLYLAAVCVKNLEICDLLIKSNVKYDCQIDNASSIDCKILEHLQILKFLSEASVDNIVLKQILLSDSAGFFLEVAFNNYQDLFVFDDVLLPIIGQALL